MKRSTIAHTKPKIIAPRASGSAFVSPTDVIIQPTVAVTRTSTKRTPVAVAVPPTVIVCECQPLIGPSVIGPSMIEPIDVLRPPGFGAPQPARAASSTALSFMIGLATMTSFRCGLGSGPSPLAAR